MVKLNYTSCPTCGSASTVLIPSGKSRKKFHYEAVCRDCKHCWECKLDIM